MKVLPVVLVIVASLAAVPARAEDETGMRAARCLVASSAAYRVPLGVLLILLRVEGGRLGRVSRNNNDTVDIGPLQVNSTWVPRVAAHWRADTNDTTIALRDNFCANIDAGSWILRQALDEAHGKLWDGVGLYHSHDPDYRRDYLRKVLAVALDLQKRSSQPILQIARR